MMNQLLTTIRVNRVTGGKGEETSKGEVYPSDEQQIVRVVESSSNCIMYHSFYRGCQSSGGSKH